MNSPNADRLTTSANDITRSTSEAARRLAYITRPKSARGFHVPMISASLETVADGVESSGELSNQNQRLLAEIAPDIDTYGNLILPICAPKVGWSRARRRSASAAASTLHATTALQVTLYGKKAPVIIGGHIRAISIAVDEVPSPDATGPAHVYVTRQGAVGHSVPPLYLGDTIQQPLQSVPASIGAEKTASFINLMLSPHIVEGVSVEPRVTVLTDTLSNLQPPVERMVWLGLTVALDQIRSSKTGM